VLKTRKFLLVDENPDGRSLLARTLHRKFPQSITLECVDSQAALAAVSGEKLDAVVIHKADDVTGLELIQLIRRMNPNVPILAVSGYDRTRESLEAGATRFLNYDQWLLVGTVIGEMIGVVPPEKR
jgi:CheY-like chemotaxis protein